MRFVVWPVGHVVPEIALITQPTDSRLMETASD
jgi:hypothetical protein